MYRTGAVRLQQVVCFVGKEGLGKRDGLAVWRFPDRMLERA